MSVAADDTPTTQQVSARAQIGLLYTKYMSEMQFKNVKSKFFTLDVNKKVMKLNFLIHNMLSDTLMSFKLIGMDH